MSSCALSAHPVIIYRQRSNKTPENKNRSVFRAEPEYGTIKRHMEHKKFSFSE